MRKVTLISLLAALSIVSLVSTVLAHDMWINVDKTVPDKPLHFLIGYGHAFPKNDGTDKESLIPAYVLGPQGKLESKAGEALDFLTKAPLAKGSYVVVGGRTAQWYTKTPEGYKDAPKDKVPGALSCVRSAKYAKAVVNLGGVAADVSKPAGQTLEIVPLANPAGIKANGELPIQVLYQGKPLANAEVKATFAGFTKDSHAFAFAARTDKEGKVMVKGWHPGLWLVVAKQEIPFADPAQCGKEAHAATLTFELK